MKEIVKLRPPETAEEFDAYYNLRWMVLRAPWNQPKGSEKDEYEGAAYHMAAYIDHHVIGVGRIHATDKKKAHIRYMAVSPEHVGQGIGSAILEKLELHAIEKGITNVELNSRDTAASFYKKHGYIVVKDGHLLYEKIPHVVMQKTLKLK